MDERKMIYLDDAMLQVAKVDINKYADMSDFHDACVDCLKNLPLAQPEITPREGCKYRMPDGERETIYLDDAIGCLYNTLESYYIKRNLLELPSAKKEEETRCDYCHEDIDGWVKPIEKNCHASIHLDNLILSAKGWNGKAKINFCPMCGRSLRHG